MRIAAIAPVGSSTAAPVDPIRWHESRRVRQVDPYESVRQREFADVLRRLEREPEQRRMRVIEVVAAPGVRREPVRTQR